jgi:hypothetical protein
MKNTQKEIFIFNIDWVYIKVQCFEKIEWGSKYWPRMNTLQIFFVIFNIFLVSAYMENTQNGE